jgi:hypothetical protein
VVADNPYERVAQIRALYRADNLVALVLDWASNRDRDAKETSADRLVDQLHIAKPQVIKVFKQFHELGCGRLLYGRRGARTRLRWFYSLRSLGKAARGEASHLDEINFDDAAEIRTKGIGGRVSGGLSGGIEYRFPLRPDLTLTVRLPEDLTGKEAERFATFIQSLPFAS